MVSSQVDCPLCHSTPKCLSGLMLSPHKAAFSLGYCQVGGSQTSTGLSQDYPNIRQ